MRRYCLRVAGWIVAPALTAAVWTGSGAVAAPGCAESCDTLPAVPPAAMALTMPLREMGWILGSWRCDDPTSTTKHFRIDYRVDGARNRIASVASGDGYYAESYLAFDVPRNVWVDDGVQRTADGRAYLRMTADDVDGGPDGIILTGVVQDDRLTRKLRLDVRKVRDDLYRTERLQERDGEWVTAGYVTCRRPWVPD